MTSLLVEGLQLYLEGAALTWAIATFAAVLMIPDPVAAEHIRKYGWYLR